jgi:hypothetical protein
MLNLLLLLLLLRRAAPVACKEISHALSYSTSGNRGLDA